MQALLGLGGADCRRAVADVHGTPLHYLSAGAGRPLLLLHGASGGGANWYRLFPALARHWQVLAPDLPGYGFSAPIDARAPLGHQVAAHLAVWLRELGMDEVDVVGTSFGGLVALRLSQHFPVRRIVAVDAVGLAPALGPLLRLATFPLFARFAAAPSRRGTRLLLRHVLTASRLPADHEDALVDYLHASALRGDVRMLARAFVQFADLRGQRDVLTREELQRLAGRLLVVWGERDRLLPRAPSERACALAGCPPVRIIPGAGHSPNWEMPQQLLHELERFLLPIAEP